MNFNQLFRYLIFDEITNFNFIDLQTRFSTSISKKRLKTTIFTFERFVFSSFSTTQIFFFTVFFSIFFKFTIFFIEFVAIRIQQFSFIFHVSRIQIENDDNSNTIISSANYSIFVKLNFDDAFR